MNTENNTAVITTPEVKVPKATLASVIRQVLKSMRRDRTITVPDQMQQWKGMNGETAWHLIHRHADGWADVGKMMGEWLEANRDRSTPA